MGLDTQPKRVVAVASPDIRASMSVGGFCVAVLTLQIQCIYRSPAQTALVKVGHKDGNGCLCVPAFGEE
ncbi:hypothetical protein EGR_01191 [Echinococcus granulosus]|uniref:Uncharacterized protein n=1 Tax=Echinococcus granulosus TaxID=6210 RepID=W6US30_ECHGR|nr:hypothetical protein EGR_01191 [Echinococcus granulosus]EUB64063.1 hypothetical protein EGR_01191 [Echinococcus granulosus]